MTTSSGSSKVCFNSNCKKAIEVSRKGWLCRTGDFADLCDRCASAYKEGKFCETYHLKASGWRCCESCGKQIHCGCIVSFHLFILLDAGGIECLNCAKTEYMLTPNPIWPSASQFLHEPPKRIRDISSNNWKYVDGKHNLFKDDSYQSFFQTNATPHFSLPETFVAHDQNSEKGKVFGKHVQRLCSPSVEKRFSNNNVPSTSRENQAHNAKAQGETPALFQPLSRYWPRFTDQEIQQLSKGSNTKITPLFEKVLSASDVGKIGRLVLPKKCAESYLPPLSQPEGYPLIIQDSNGNDWVLQYRFWPNNNSRMYVLEGITPCIQSMQLQAGDTVTFSKLEPEGKLIMGFRKASLVSPFHKENEITNTRVSTYEETLNDNMSRNPDGTCSEADKMSICGQRKKGDKMFSNGKNFKLKHEEMLQLRVTLEQVQELLQPPLTNSPTVLLTDDGVQFEVFLEAPIIGRSTEFSTDNVGSICSMELEPTSEHLESFENDPIREKSSSSFFISQNIDLNTRPEWEEESSPVSDSMGLMRLAQESTRRYINPQKQSINGITYGNHKNHDL